MRHILSGLVLAAALGLSVPAPAAAQNLFAPVVYVNDSVVTRYEVDQRMRFMQLIGAPGTDARAAEDALIDDRLRVQAARQIGVEITPEGLEAGMEEFAGRAGLDAASFIARLEAQGIERGVFRDFIEAGTVWREVVRARVLPQVNVPDAEVEQELRRVIETPIIDRVALSEIIIPAPPGQEAQALALAERIVAGATSEAAFAAAARQYSAVPSAQAGGRLETVALDNLPPTLRPIITALQPGQATQPLTVEGAVVIFFLRDAQGTLRPGAREQRLEWLSLRLASGAEAARLAQVVRSCDDLYVQAGEAAPQVRRQNATQGAIPTLVGTRLASLDPDEAGVIPAPDGTAELVMLCTREPALAAQPSEDALVLEEGELEDTAEEAPVASDLPGRSQVRDQLFNRKINTAADNLLADLRANAVIRRP